MSRAARLLDLLELLRSRKAPISGTELAERMGVSIRTLYRDIVTLQAQGADIVGEPGLGYVLRPGFTLPPLMFGASEIEALVLGSRWVAARSGDAQLSQSASMALSKIMAVLPAELRERAEATNLLVARQRIEQYVDPSLIRLAIRNEQKLVIAYRALDGIVTNRVIWPFLIGFFETARIVAGWCELRSDYRHFRLDRIESAQLLDGRYPRRRAVMAKEWRARENVPPP